MDEKLKDLIPKDFFKGQDDLVDSLNDFIESLDQESEKEPCKETSEDCDDVVSPCCNFGLDIIFGTLPLEVKCLKCNKIYKLSSLITS